MYTDYGVRRMMDIVNPLAHTRRKEALGTSVALGHQSLVLLHGNEQAGGRTKRKEVVNLREGKERNVSRGLGRAD